MASIFDYSDYRQFLKDHYQELRKKDKKYSHRFFALKAGFSSSGFFADVISGRRNISSAFILRFAHALGLSGEAQIYFENLVLLNQAKTLEEKKYYFEKLLALKHVKASVLSKDQYEFFSKWHYAAVREVILFCRFRGDFAELANTLRPTIKPSQARSAVRLLERLKLIEKHENGVYRQTSAVLTTGNAHKSLHLINFQLAMMDLGREALDRFPREDRDITTLTLTVSRNYLEYARQEIAALRQRLLATAEKDPEADRTYQINFQVFPLSK